MVRVPEDRASEYDASSLSMLGGHPLHVNEMFNSESVLVLPTAKG
jgi:hypothetical protein